ncbi:hypothetical protein ULG90_08910 [Halopseudomonas pachastrellae]|nr:hypothetical protein ULG90_08910 [Halopseudomonas pachastrellae]
MLVQVAGQRVDVGLVEQRFNLGMPCFSLRVAGYAGREVCQFLGLGFDGVTRATENAVLVGQRLTAAKSYGEHQQHGSVDPHHLSLVRWRAAFAETALQAKAEGRAYCACGRPLPLQRWSVYQKARAAHA